MVSEPKFVDIDVSKLQLDVAVRPTGEGFSKIYDENGIASLIRRLRELKPERNLCRTLLAPALFPMAALAEAQDWARDCFC
jgi:hypothetical protein